MVLVEEGQEALRELIGGGSLDDVLKLPDDLLAGDALLRDVGGVYLVGRVGGWLTSLEFQTGETVLEWNVEGVGGSAESDFGPAYDDHRARQV